MPAEAQHTPVFTKKVHAGSQKVKSQKVPGKRGHLMEEDASDIRSFDHGETRKRDSKGARKHLESNEKNHFLQHQVEQTRLRGNSDDLCLQTPTQ